MHLIYRVGKTPVPDMSEGGTTMRQMATTWLVKRWNLRHVIGALAMLWTSQYPIIGYGQSAMLYWLGAPPGGRSVATDVSNTGIVVGYVQTSSGTHYAFYWRSDTGLQTLNQSASGAEAVEDGIHGGRFMMVGWVARPPSEFMSSAFSWRSNWSNIRYELGSRYSSAFDIGHEVGAPDKQYVVGWADYAGYPYAAYWISGERYVNGPYFLEGTPPSRHSYALAIGDIIPRIVGRIKDDQGNWRAFYWDGLAGYGLNIYELGTLGGCCSSAEDVSGEGHVIVGWAWDGNNRVRAFRWQGIMQDLGTLPGGNDSMAYSVDIAGYTIVGTSQFRKPSGELEFRATMWEGSRITDLNQLVRDQLVPGSRLIEAKAISPNSRYIAGWGYNAATARFEAFLLDRAPQIPGDIDGDGCVNDSDLLLVLLAFGNAGGAEDTNNDGVVDDADLLSVLLHFGEGQC